MRSETGFSEPPRGVKVIEGDSSAIIHRRILELESQGWILVNDMAERLLEDGACFVAVLRAPFTGR